MAPRISVVIPTYNRLPQLQRALAALERQTTPLDQFEVVVVSDGATDGTEQALPAYRGPLHLRLVTQANGGPAAARNRGFREAHGELVIFLDDDMVAGPHLIAEHIRLQANQPDLVVLGPLLTPIDGALDPWVAWEQAMLEKQYRAMAEGQWSATARQFYTGNTSLLRSHLIATGGFDERFRRAEDVELAYRLAQRGMRFVFHPAAAGYHYAQRSFQSWLAIPYAYGRNDATFALEGEAWLLKAIHEEFGERNRLTQLLVRGFVQQPWLSYLVQQGLSLVAQLCYRFGVRRATQAAYSAIFNLRYYQGVAEVIGARAFLAPQPLELAEAKVQS